MREIKFRAWDKNNKEMLQVDLLGKHTVKCSGEGWRDRIDFEVMQFTGLHDKHGREIYEGDLWKDGDGVIYVVRWDKKWASFAIFHSEYDYHYSIPQSALKTGEVIGNVWENPDLLEALGKCVRLGTKLERLL